MLLWFVGTAVVAVWYVFRDRRFDYRLVVVGALLPELDVVAGGMRILHTLVFSVALLTAVMVVTAGRKPSRRLLLGLPIGTFLHLVFDGAWATTHVFWWPFGGFAFDDAVLPAVSRGWWNLPLELVGAATCVWVWRAGQLGDASRRRDFLQHGVLNLSGADPRSSRPHRAQRGAPSAGTDRRAARRRR